jgi:cardiolipin synthase
MPLISARDRDPDDAYFTRILTLPNLITLARLLLLVPVCWLIVVGAEGSWWPVVLLALWASTDWIDGALARALDQSSRLGEVMDPVADRIGIIGVTLALAISGAVDWWILAVIAGIDVLTVAFAGKAARDGSIHVTWLGKWRTAVMLSAIVVILLGHTVLPWATPVGMTLMLIGLGLHVVAGIDYFLQARRLRGVHTGGLERHDDESGHDEPEEAR